MILSPGVLVLTGISVLLTACALYVAGAGLRIVHGWAPDSSSEAQLVRERRTVLLSSLLGFTLVVELLCLFFFVVLVDRMHVLFTGAMCAAGTLNANAYGNPALLVMLGGVVLCILWLVVNHLDALSPRFPLIRLKYFCLVPVAIVLGLQSFLLVKYFLSLDPAFITSCCATFFDAEGTGLSSELAHLSPALMEPVFWATLIGTIVVGAFSIGTGALGRLYGGLSTVMLPVGLVAVVSFISIRIYELPTHHCPFCLLQAEHGYVGYPLYCGLLLGSVLGMGAGILHWLGRRPALKDLAAQLGWQLRCWSLAGYILLGGLAGRPLLLSPFRL